MEEGPDFTAAEKATLRRGWTTGACAACAAKAAYQALLTGAFPEPVEIVLPRGERPSMVLIRADLPGDGTATAGVVKDAGDDPDVTHGAQVLATVRLLPPGAGITFHAGPGVGTVTKPGLVLAVGEPAINPGPRGMIATAIGEVAARFGGTGDVAVTVSIPGGEALAEKTLNGRLGILGGLSILGTTGVVVPFSCSAWIHSIHRGIDVARATGLTHLAAATGSTSERAARDLLGLDEAAMLDMGDFAGGLLKYLRRHPVPRFTLAGGFAKVCKLAQGDLFLHSAKSRIDMDRLADTLAAVGGAAADVAAARGANTALQVLQRAQAAGLPLADAVAARARDVVAGVLGPGIRAGVLVFDRQGRLVGRADG
ncbi:MAG: cobalt-precorrin-5B (C(1))-methyltransferase [Hyphomicrobiales bacterium]|nr:cobalt-precorrin-5B (C(1))-methyltransferase [Hyphomicrobiales bacterium]